MARRPVSRPQQAPDLNGDFHTATDDQTERGVLLLVGKLHGAVRALEQRDENQRLDLDRLRSDIRSEMADLNSSIRQIANGVTTAVDTIRTVKDEVSDLTKTVAEHAVEVADYKTRKIQIAALRWGWGRICIVIGGIASTVAFVLGALYQFAPHILMR
jgi:hypothetical protein